MCSLFALSTLAGAAETSQCRYRLAGALPLQYHGAGMALAVQGKLNDTPAMLMIDTGSQLTALTRLGTDKRQLHLVPTVRAVEGVGGVSRLYRVTIRSIELGPIKIGERGSLLAIDEMGSRPEYDLILGSDFLMDMDVELALADKQLKFFAPQHCEQTFLGYWDKNTLVTPLERDADGIRPVVTVELNGVKLRALIDSGAASSVVSSKAARRAGVTADSQAIVDKGQATGVGQKVIDTHTARFKSFAISDEKIENPVLRIIDMDRGQIDVILGMDFLRAHRILLAHSQKLMYFTYVGGKPFDEGKAGERAWIDQEAAAGNSSAQYLVARAKLASDKQAEQAAGQGLMTQAAAAGNMRALHYLGWKQFEDGRYADSVATYAKLEALDPSDLAAKLDLFNARVKTSGVAEARAQLQTAMSSLRWPVWPAAVTEYYLGKRSLESLLREAGSEKDIATRRRCEVLDYAATFLQASGDSAQHTSVSASLQAECGKGS